MEEKERKETWKQVINDYECEEEPLNVDELMDIEGGKDEIPIKRCGLGCLLGGVKEVKKSSENGNNGTEAR